MSDKVALITGAGNGIGKHTALAFADDKNCQPKQKSQTHCLAFAFSSTPPLNPQVSSNQQGVGLTRLDL